MLRQTLLTESGVCVRALVEYSLYDSLKLQVTFLVSNSRATHKTNTFICS